MRVTLVIANGSGKFWASESGWMEHPKLADRFSLAESDTVRKLPQGGFWITYRSALRLLRNKA